ncbi:hypothetical protein TRV_06250 [Trichophyton verrucosum HKI 0517]|uniref:Uncharacterized protein n=1 Tax=Trichophyton verrucosum (strain HKI 0517) TaxID=663202 RepID=D4DGE7_TRIVH|nr:uncharacterized protein TRV_06250 [Trichophyton verrucosum HKI 0517]EFE39080.1 hypothetical protein TRV_06250 [Trichophyton verrucosum HKI 0517]
MRSEKKKKKKKKKSPSSRLDSLACPSSCSFSPTKRREEKKDF